MKFLCVPCNEPMKLKKTDEAEGGSLSLDFHCPTCDYNVAMLTNTGETQLVQSLGVHFGQSNGAVSPMEALRANMVEGKDSALTQDTKPEPTWTEEAKLRLAEHPQFVQPVILKTYTDFARRENMNEITIEVMNQAQKSLKTP